MVNFEILAAILKIKKTFLRQLMENNLNLKYPVFFLFKTMIKHEVNLL